MTCPGCNNEVKGNFCPTCKKPVTMGTMGTDKKPAASAGTPSAAAHLNRSAAMDQKGSGPKVKDKTVDGYEKSNAVQSKYSSHLIAKDKASDFGNMTRSNRWKLAETIAMALLLVASIIGIVALMLPFFSGILATGTGEAEDITGLGSMGFDYGDSSGAIIGTMAMLSMIAFGLTALLALLKLAAIAVPALGFVNQTPVAIAHAVLAILAMVFAILVFTSVSAFISNGAVAGLINFVGSSGIGTLLLLIAGISATVVGLAGALTRLKLNTLNQAIKG